MKSLFFIVLVAALLVPTAAFAQDDAPLMGDWETCPEPASLSGEVTIGAIFALTERASVYGTVQQQSVQLAIDEINASGYLGGATLNVIFEDSASVPETTIT